MTSKILAWEIEKYAKVLYVYIYIKKKNPVWTEEKWY